MRNLIRAGVPEKIAVMTSSHKTRAVLDGYNIVDERDINDAARNLADYMAHKGTPEPAAADERHTSGTQNRPEAGGAAIANCCQVAELIGADERT